jgi:hypothetical protein
LRRSHSLAVGLVWLLLGALAASGLACREASEPKAERQIPELRFAGVDLIYALRRVAAEADVILLLDEIRPPLAVADLGLVRVDVDLPAGPLASALDRLQKVAPRFEYRIEDDLVYVRSDTSIETTTTLDAKVVTGGSFEGDVRALGAWLSGQVPGAYISGEMAVGTPVFAKVKLEVAPNSSILDVYTAFARALHWGWHMRRAGYIYEKTPDRTAIVSSTVTLWPRLTEPNFIYPGRHTDPGLRAIASISKRNNTPMVVVDRSLLVRNQGQIDNISSVWDEGGELPVLLDNIAGPKEPKYQWERRDGIIYMRSYLYDYEDKGEGILRAKVHGGSFRGSFPEYARWLNSNLATDTKQVLMAGEIDGDEPAFSLEVQEGWTVEEALLAFTKATGAGWVFIAQERLTPSDTPDKPKSKGGWGGGYLTLLSRWFAEADWAAAVM